jgi:hypothetical protein
MAKKCLALGAVYAALATRAYGEVAGFKHCEGEGNYGQNARATQICEGAAQKSLEAIRLFVATVPDPPFRHAYNGHA